MSLREFRDGAGIEWRVWDITTESMHPVTAREMFIGRYVDFQEGWLVFESANERRRLAPYPAQWADFPVDQLETLLQMATPSPTRLGRESSGSFPRIAEKRALAEETGAARAVEHEAAAATPAPPRASFLPARDDCRDFVGPSGRRWLVSLTDAAEAGPRGRRLRFVANDGTICELAEWPDDWPRFTTAQLMELLRRAELARDASGSDGHPPRRRREDREP